MPIQEIVFVGFVINSVFMTIRLTPEKAEDIVKMYKSNLNWGIAILEIWLN